mmetsp:Transcript_41455/g.84595  ORF Transcript_41455/g.84595 Transcript_41455/m.84595 type:complete len:235 (-) Transcript_41455:100-804(-)
MGLPSPEAALQDHHALLGWAALSVEVGDCRSPMCRVLAQEGHDGLVRKHLHKFLDLLEEIHGRDVFRSWDCPASPILPTQIDHDHALMILLPKFLEVNWVHPLHALVLGHLAINQRQLLPLWGLHVRGHHLWLWAWEAHLGIGKMSSGALKGGCIYPLRWLRHGLDHVLHHGRHWHHAPWFHLSRQLMHLSKPWLRCLRMRQHHWLPRHGLPQHQAWLHLLHRLHRVHHLHLHG